MPHAKPRSKATRDTVLGELALMAEGRHPECQNITERFVRCPHFQQACKILADAIQVQTHRYGAKREEVVPPPAWLLPV